MHKIIEEELLINLKWLISNHKLKECESVKLKNILIKIAQNRLGARFDSGENVTNDDLKYGVWDHPNIHSYLSKIPHSKVFKLFESNSISKILELELYFYDLNFAVLFYTNEELKEIIESFISYLINNRNAISATGFPLKIFGLGYWFDKCLSCTYPTKMPSSVRKIKDRDGNLIFEYHWSKLPKHSDDFTNLEQQDYLKSPNFRGYSLENIDFIENKRSMIFNLKLKILDILSNSLVNKNYSNLWDHCLEVIADSMTIEDFNTFNEVGNSYLLPASLSGEWQENPLEEDAKSELDWVLRFGGIIDILELIYEVEKELRFGYVNKIKHKLLNLSESKKLSTYFDLIINFDISYLFTIAEEYLKCKKEEKKFRNFFVKRLLKSIEKSFRVPILVKSSEYNKIQQFVKLFETNQSLNMNFPESEKIHKDNIRNITPLSLPSNTKWIQIVLKFIDNESIEIKGPGNFNKVVTFREMGFANQRKHGKPPTILWDFLRALSLTNGVLSWDLLTKKTKNPKIIHDAINNGKKRKQLVSQRLKAFFRIKDDPIIFDRKKRIYQTMFTIFPQDHLMDL